MSNRPAVIDLVGDNVHLSNMHIDGAPGHVGIRLRGRNNVVSGNRFTNVEQAYDIEDSSSTTVETTRILSNSVPSPSQVGWRRPKGPALPAFCRTCKIVFPSRNYSVNSPLIYARDNQDRCPQCHSFNASLANGLFALTLDAFKIIDGPDFTHAMLLAMQEVGQDFILGKVGLEEALGKIQNISKDVCSKITSALSVCITWGMFAMTAASLYVAIESRDLSKEQLDLARRAEIRAQLESNPGSVQAVHETLHELGRVIFTPPPSTHQGEGGEKDAQTSKPKPE